MADPVWDDTKEVSEGTRSIFRSFFDKALAEIEEEEKEKKDGRTKCTDED